MVVVEVKEADVAHFEIARFERVLAWEHKQTKQPTRRCANLCCLVIKDLIETEVYNGLIDR